MKKREKIWVVREGDGKTVADILGHTGEDATAVEAGRVFVGKERVTDAGRAVAVGDEIRIGPRDEEHRVIHILARGEGIVAVEKIAGIPTVPDRAGSDHSLVARTAAILDKPVTDLRITSRLDREVSGVVIFALDEAAEKRLIEARNAGNYRRRYLAVAWLEKDLADSGAWVGAIGQGRDAMHRAVDGADSKPSATHYRVVARAGKAALLCVEPITGRTHQIRVHASHAGAPLVGDRDYGGPGRITAEGGKVVATSRIALHAARVTVPGLTVEAPIPAELEEMWSTVGGDASAWKAALDLKM